MVKFQHHSLKNLLIYTYIYLLTPPTRPDYSQASSTVPSSEFLPYVPTQMIKHYEQRFFLNGSRHEATKAHKIKPLFLKAIVHMKRYSGSFNTTNNDHIVVIFHLPFHPNDPPSYRIQQAWRDSIASPKYHMPLPDMRNPKSKEKSNIQRMIIAYRRPMNIGNLLSHRNLDTNSTAPPVSSYYPFD